MKLPHQAANFIRTKIKNFTPKIGIILGSGLGGLTSAIQDAQIISYADIPGFPQSTIAGHSGHLHIGYIHETPVACLAGRAHYYEGIERSAFHNLIRTMKLLGCESLIITNASGSLRETVPPGSIVMITDHINFLPFNPMVGPNDDEFGPRFFSMEDVYDFGLREHFHKTAHDLNIALETGVYIAVSGPSFETPAEIRAFKILGADVVGMSTIPEVITARHCGLRVCVLSVISNYAAGMSSEKLSHELTLKGAQLAAEKIIQLITTAVKKFA